jgi:hypothetical protein
MQKGPHPHLRQDVPDAAGALLHPVTLAALALLLLNDHVLKAAWPGPVTGKLSDLAGMAFFPILLLSAWELVFALRGRWRGPTVLALATAVAVTAAGFILIKTVPMAAQTAGWMLGWSQWLLSLPVHLLMGAPLPPISRAMIVADPTDLAALPALTLAIGVGASRLQSGAVPATRSAIAARAMR